MKTPFVYAYLCATLLSFHPWHTITAAEAPGESQVCGRALYLQVADQPFDTVLAMDTAGKTIIRITSPSAMGVAILSAMGYQIGVMAQYRWELAKPILLPANPTRNKMAQILVSNYLFEPVASCTASGDAGAGMRVAMSFAACGQSSYNGRSIITDTAVLMDFSRELSRASMYTGDDIGRLLFRRVFGVYLLLDKQENPAEIVKKVEKEMDRLKLDLSYKTPQLKVCRRL